MSDKMTPLSFEELMEWIIEENKVQGKIFGISRFFKNNGSNVRSLFGEELEAPFGIAAGPHTQLAQNIVAAYLSGCRFFELKTVQTLDGEDLPVAKPCINAEDEGYNVEWSTELRVPQAFEEYVKAWFALKLLSKELELGSPDGFIFNMSVGYDFKGITSEKIDSFIMGLKDAEGCDIWKECMSYTMDNINSFKNLDKDYVRGISPKISSSITLSTLHGCPAEEIQRIAAYLITEKGLNTFVKCNPTLLGYEFARNTLDTMGYDYVSFDEFHFNNDLQYPNAIKMFKELQALAEERGLSFGVKLTNTFPVKIKNKELPGEEMYMSGKALYPLSIALASRLSEDFQGSLKISFSGGADAFNIKKIVEAGIWPVTIATTLLKIGGYTRCLQIAEELRDLEYTEGFIIDNEKLQALKEDSLINYHHIKHPKAKGVRKTKEKVPLTDCFIAGCQVGCPISQDIPEYISQIEKGKYNEALKVILEKNPLPFITGTICSHPCMPACSRNFCEEAVDIRGLKLLAAEKGYEEVVKGFKAEEGAKVKAAIIGGGTTGIAAAHYLARAGIDTTIFEKRSSLGGIVKHIIPDFRIPEESIEKDIKLMELLGIKIKLNSEETSIEKLKKQGYKYVLIAVGAWKEGCLDIPGGEVIKVISFLEGLKDKSSTIDLGRNVAIIGGGNTAVDAARAAKRLKSVEKVYMVYRRTKEYMPAEFEELQHALKEGIELKELLSPKEIKEGQLICEVMKLGEADESGRRAPIPTGEIISLKADSVISAIGEKIDSGIYVKNNIAVDKNSKPLVDFNTLETNIENVFVAGDGLRGPATVVQGMADAKRFAEAVFKKEKINKPSSLLKNNEKNIKAAEAKRGILKMAIKGEKEGERCLQCSTLCEACAEVCPNRANASVVVKGNVMPQIVHIDRLCNECGNCETFCPYSSAPYKEKLTLFSSIKDFEESKNIGFIVMDREKMLIKVRLEEKVFDVSLEENHSLLPNGIEDIITSIIKDYSYMI